MGLLNHMESLTLGSKKDKDRRASGADVADGRDADTSTLDKEEGNILMSLISQRESSAAWCRVAARKGGLGSELGAPRLPLPPPDHLAPARCRQHSPLASAACSPRVQLTSQEPQLTPSPPRHGPDKDRAPDIRP